MKLVAMLQVYNELESGNLERCMTSLARYCDAVQIYDDGSTDGSYEYIMDWWKPWTRGRVLIPNTKPWCRLEEIDVIRSTNNDFSSELQHKQLQLDRCKELRADWIVRLDADEVVEAKGEDVNNGVRELCSTDKYDSWAFHMVNLWRSPYYYRIDGSWNDVVFNRLWRVGEAGLKFNIENGLHKTNYPIGATDNEGFAPFEILHYGFASDTEIIRKYNTYKKHGQTGWALNRIVDESTLALRRANKSWYASMPKHVAPPSEFCKTPIKRAVL